MSLFELGHASNDELLFAHARPGSIGFVGFAGRAFAEATRLASSLRVGAMAGLWSHAFIVLDRRVRAGRDQIVIVETARIPPAHRSIAAARGHPAWEGPQWSILVSRAQGAEASEVRGHCNRRACRRYRLDAWTPNVAIMDSGLSGASLRALQRRMRAALRPASRLAWAAKSDAIQGSLRERGLSESLFEADDPSSGAFVVEMLAGLVPGLGALRGADSPLAVARLYDALCERLRVVARIRSPVVEARSPATPELAAALSLLDASLCPRSAPRVLVPGGQTSRTTEAHSAAASPTPS